jgi:hypothetical protein
MKRITLILGVLALVATGCDSSTPSSSDQAPARQVAEDHSYEAEKARDAATVAAKAHRRESERIKATCAHRRALGSIETTQECERSQQEIEATLAKSKRSLAEGHAYKVRLKQEEEAMTPAEKSRIAGENARAAKAAKELGQTAAREEAAAKRHKQEHTYPPEAQHEFLVGCAAGEHSPSVCHCWLHKVEARDTLPELEALSYAITHGAPVPSGVKEGLEACAFSGG